jgi:WD40 repeat protein
MTHGKSSRVLSPWFLPDGRHVLLSIADEPGIYVASIDAPSLKKVLDRGSQATYGDGYLFYSSGTALFARPFDIERLEVIGTEVQLADHGYNLSVSDDGTIAFRSAGAGLLSTSTLTWFDRSGRRTGTLGQPGSPYSQVVFSPRGRHVTVERADDQSDDLWDADLATGVFSRLTTAPGMDADPSWSPDERTIVFTSARLGRFTPFVKDRVSGKEEPLVASDDPVVVDQWTPDGRFVIVRGAGGKRIYAVPMGQDRTPHLVFDTPYVKDEVHVSPDGRWVAFNANESGRWQVYVAAFPTFTSKQQVSAEGGVQPQWRADGRELFYLASDGSMMSVPVNTRAGLVVGPPSRLFSTRVGATPYIPQYAVTADGQRFLALEPPPAQNTFTFLINWLNAPVSNSRGLVQ